MVIRMITDNEQKPKIFIKAHTITITGFHMVFDDQKKSWYYPKQKRFEYRVHAMVSRDDIYDLLFWMIASYEKIWIPRAIDSHDAIENHRVQSIVYLDPDIHRPPNNFEEEGPERSAALHSYHGNDQVLLSI